MIKSMWLLIAVGMLIGPAFSPLGRCDLVPNGNFEAPVDGIPGGWEPKPNPNFQIVQNGANHYAVLTKVDPNYSPVAQVVVPVDPTWKQVDISARMKARRLVVGTETWQTARVTTVFLDENKKIAHYASASTLWVDTDWVSRTLRDDVPADAKFLSIQIGVWGPAGELSVDDVKLIPNPSFGAPAFPATLDGSFEKLDANGDSADWPAGGSGWAVASEAGNHFLRASVTNPTVRPEFRVPFAVGAGWKAVTVSARIRGKDIKPGDKPGQFPRLEFQFLDANGNMIYPLQASSIELPASADWATKSSTFSVPSNARFFILQPAMRNCIGVADIDDVKVVPAS